MNASTKKTILKISGDSARETDDVIAVEKRLRISINGREIVSLYCTPVMIRELVVGMVMTEGIIKGEWCVDRMTIEYGEDVLAGIQAAEADVSEGRKIITSGCVGGVTFERKAESEKIKDDLRIDAEALLEIFREFHNRSELYHLTGCIHSAALSDGKNIIAFAEDIGRHNAIDKVIGYALLEELGFSGKIMLASGRLSSEMASKCSRWGIPIIASRTAPTDRAVEIAEKRGMTLVGFVRSNRLNVYTHPQRIEH